MNVRVVYSGLPILVYRQQPNNQQKKVFVTDVLAQYVVDTIIRQRSGKEQCALRSLKGLRPCASNRDWMNYSLTHSLSHIVNHCNTTPAQSSMQQPMWWRRRLRPLSGTNKQTNKNRHQCVIGPHQSTTYIERPNDPVQSGSTLIVQWLHLYSMVKWQSHSFGNLPFPLSRHNNTSLGLVLSGVPMTRHSCTLKVSQQCWTLCQHTIEGEKVRACVCACFWGLIAMYNNVYVKQ